MVPKIGFVYGSKGIILNLKSSTGRLINVCHKNHKEHEVNLSRKW